MCRDCILLARQHKDHEYSLITEVAQKKKAVILEDLKEVEKLAEKYDATLIGIEQAERDVAKQQTELSEQIAASFQALFTVLQEQKQVLLDSANEQVEQKLSIIATQKEHLRTVSSELGGLIELVDATIARKDNHHFLLKVPKLKVRIGKVAEQAKTRTNHGPAAQPDLVARALPPAGLRQMCTLTTYVRRADPDPSRCTIVRCRLQNGTVGDTSTFVVHLVNKHDISCHGDVAVELRMLRDGEVTRPTVTALSPSRYEVSYTPATRGRHELSVTVNGEHITGSPFKVFVRISLQQLSAPKTAITDLVGPSAVHFTGERILVTDHGDDCVIAYSLDNKRIAKIGGDSILRRRKLKKCIASTTDSESNIYVATIGDNVVHKFSKEGTHIKSVSGGGTGENGGHFKLPNAMCVVENHLLYVCDAKRNRIVRLNTDLDYLYTIAIEGMPISISVNDNKMYVCIKDSELIRVLDMNGQQLHNIGHTALYIPVTTAVFDNLLYVTDFENHCVVIFTLGGNFVGSFGHGHLCSPEGLTIDDDGYFYITNNRMNVMVF